MALPGILKQILISTLHELESSDDEMQEEMVLLAKEEEINVLPHERAVISKTKGYVETVVSQFGDSTFKSHFRMHPSTFEVIENMISGQLYKSAGPGHPSLPPRNQLLMALWLTSTPESYRSVSDRFEVSRATLWTTCKKVWTALASLSKEVIQFPSEACMERHHNEFQKICGFPKVIGCIDGCHIPIKAPQKFPESYLNQKGFHSVLLQGVVNARCIFIDCYTGDVGSMHDARMFRRSHLGRNLDTLIPPTYHLLGDSAYPLLVNLLTPFRDNGHLTRQEVQYNKWHSQTRSTVERAFALLKGRFRRLKFIDMDDQEQIVIFIMACCVLHNICQNNSDVLEQDVFTLSDDMNEEVCRAEGIDKTPEAEHKRNTIMNFLSQTKQ